MSSSSKVARLRTALSAPEAASAPTLGPAEIVEIDGPLHATLRLASGDLRPARLALAFTYAPAVGDTVLAIGGPDGHYVIGVLDGRGTSTLAIPGDVELRAVGGTLKLAGDKGVCVEGDHVEVRATTIATIATTLSQKVHALRQQITDLWSVRAGQRHTVVDGASYQQAESATIIAKEDVIVDGKTVHLG